MTEKKYSPEDWIETFASYVGAETFKLLHDYAKERNQDYEKLMARYINHLLKNSLAYLLLTETKDITKTERQNLNNVNKIYKSFKFNVETEVANSFTAAIKKLTNESVNYLCKIDVVPEPNNKHLN